MIIKLYKSTSERIRLDKTSHLVELASLSGTLRAECDLLNPSIAVELPPESVNVVTGGGDSIATSGGDPVGIARNDVTSANYAYIPEFRRYYFIADITITNSTRGENRLYIISLEVDVLMSYKDQIENLSPYVARNEFEYDSLLEDSAMPFQEVKDVTEYAPSLGALVNTHLVSDVDGSYPRNIVANLITDIPAETGDVNPPTGSNLPVVRPLYFSAYKSGCPYAIDYVTYGEIARNIMGDSSAKAQFVKSIVAFPFLPTSDALGSDILHFGDSSDSSSRMYDGDGNELRGRKTRYFSRYLVVADFSIPRAEDFYEFAPWASYEIFIPFLGWKNLDYQAVKGHRLIVFYTCNYEDGSGDVYIYDMTDRKLIYSSSCQLGVKLALTSTNHQQINEERTALGANLAIGAVTSAVGAISGNPFAVAGGLIGGAKTITDYMINTARLHESAQSSFSGSVGSLFAPLQVRLRITKPVPTFTDIDAYAHLYGRPLRDFRTLRNLSGMTMVGDVHLDDFLALEAEKTRIVQILQSGVIL